MQATTSKSGIEVAQRLLEAWNARNLDAFVALLADEIEWYDPAMPQPPARGRAEVRAFAEAMLKAFPDFRYEIQPPICTAADESRCAIVWKISATHQQPLRPPGYAPTGRKASFEGVDVLDIREGQVTRILTAFDVLAAAEQLLGMKLRPTPGSWRARVLVGIQHVLAWVARIRG